MSLPSRRALFLLPVLLLLLLAQPVVATETTPTPPGIPGVRPKPPEAPRPDPPTRVPAPQTEDEGTGGGSRSRTSRSTGDRETTEPGARVWPLAPGDYTFTQPFGCVPQLGYYAAVAGCPAAAPAMHTGIDLAAPLGTLFYAAASGTVASVGPDRPAGPPNPQIVIAHDGPNAAYATEYYHWITAFVQPGQHVEAGQAIGEVGSVGYSTGPHLHFGMIDLANGARLDPLEWLPDDPSGGAYTGVAPGSVVTSYPNVSVGVPDTADPEPPPVPTIPPAIPTPKPQPTPKPAKPSDTPDPTEIPAPTQVPTMPPAPEPTEPPAPTPVPTEAPTLPPTPVPPPPTEVPAEAAPPVAAEETPAA